MESYKYTAVSADGAKVKGVIDAIDKYAAISKIKAEYPVVLKLEEVKESRFNDLMSADISNKLDEKALAVMCSQFAIILKSGVPIDTSIRIIANQTKDKKLKKMLEKSQADVSQGVPMAEAFERNCPQLPLTFIETVRAGELTGNLEASFATMQDFYEKNYKLKQRTRSAMTYPIFVLAVAVVVIMVIMVKVVPTLTSIFDELGGELPPTTQFLIAASNFCAKWWWLIIGFILILIIGIKFLHHTEQGKINFNKRLLKYPIAGNLSMLNSSAQFSNTMATLLRAGLPVGDALLATSKTLSNAYLGRQARNYVEKIMEGNRLGDLMRAGNDFPQVLTEMTAIGEDTGELEDTLEVIGDYYTNEFDNATKQAIAKLEPTLLIFLAIFAGFIVISVYLPMFTMYNNM